MLEAISSSNFSNFSVTPRKKMKKIIFSGCGHLTPYHFGAAIYLHQQQQIMSSSNIVVAGVSGGALVAALLRFAPDKLNDVADYEFGPKPTSMKTPFTDLEGSLQRRAERRAVAAAKKRPSI